MSVKIFSSILIAAILLEQVKVVRDAMNRALEMWKEVTDSTEDVSAPSKSACYPAGKA